MSELPKVSGILPVGYGDTFFRVAMDSFLASTYEGELELVIVDNNDEPIEHLIPNDPRVKYFRCDRIPVGALRNFGTERATGEICISIDEDDYSHPERVAQQVGRILETGKSVTGYHSIYYYDMYTGGTYKYWFSQHRAHHPYACGSSQCYTKAWWEGHKFPDTGIEDWGFAQTAMHSNQLDSTDGAHYMVARAHNTSVCFPTQLGIHQQFPVVPKDELPAEFYSAIAPKVVAKPKSIKAVDTGVTDHA